MSARRLVRQDTSTGADRARPDDELLSSLTISRVRPQTTRGAATRQKLLQTAVRLLHQHGYAATTFQLLSEEASVSRGSILHQFPTRLDLIMAVVNLVIHEINAVGDSMLNAEPSPRKRLLRYFDVAWHVLNLPDSQALFEIQAAANWDYELAACIKPVTDRWYVESIDRVVLTIASEAGIPDPPSIIPQQRLLSAAMRALVRDVAFHGSDAPLLAALEALRGHYTSFVKQALKEK